MKRISWSHFWIAWFIPICRDFWREVITKIRENDHIFVQFLDVSILGQTLIDFKGPRQRCLCLHQFTTFIFCLTKKEEITLFTLSCPTWWSCRTVVFHGPLCFWLWLGCRAFGRLLHLAHLNLLGLRLFIALGSQIWCDWWFALKHFDGKEGKGPNGPNIQTSMRWISRKSPGKADARKAQAQQKVHVTSSWRHCSCGNLATATTVDHSDEARKVWEAKALGRANANKQVLKQDLEGSCWQEATNVLHMALQGCYVLCIWKWNEYILLALAKRCRCKGSTYWSPPIGVTEHSHTAPLQCSPRPYGSQPCHSHLMLLPSTCSGALKMVTLLSLVLGY